MEGGTGTEKIKNKGDSMNPFDTYVTAYKTASVGDAFLGGMMANSVNGSRDEDTPSYSDAQIAAMEKDAGKRENRIRAMVDAADTDRGHLSRGGGRLLGGAMGGIAGLNLGEAIGMMFADKTNLQSKAPAIGGLIGLTAGAVGGGMLGNRIVRNGEESRKKEYELGLRRKIRALVG